eukprot:CAMPEP_0114997378 /NCGR_PEP_ID=MMETSP0216-20121206/14864_1 /TAXON_ID=223996 /ORGANISM="Protocruzia adherens, Strain Boccale" /LENGTH=394 /DNA_ID=CAMNT_0002361749 /DNA_START=154 /DNA_END=1338 /DNA_ORIENTATION=+
MIKKQQALLANLLLVLFLGPSVCDPRCQEVDVGLQSGGADVVNIGTTQSEWLAEGSKRFTAEENPIIFYVSYFRDDGMEMDGIPEIRSVNGLGLNSAIVSNESAIEDLDVDQYQGRATDDIKVTFNCKLAETEEYHLTFNWKNCPGQTIKFSKVCSDSTEPGLSGLSVTYKPYWGYFVKDGVVTSDMKELLDENLSNLHKRTTKAFSLLYLALEEDAETADVTIKPKVVANEDIVKVTLKSKHLDGNGLQVTKDPHRLYLGYECIRGGDASVTLYLEVPEAKDISMNFIKACPVMKASASAGSDDNEDASSIWADLFIWMILIGCAFCLFSCLKNYRDGRRGLDALPYRSTVKKSYEMATRTSFTKKLNEDPESEFFSDEQAFGIKAPSYGSTS